MKIVTILGTRPEIIRLSGVISLLDRSCEHILVHTGQNFDERLDRVFFMELGVREPNHRWDCRAESASEQIGKILAESERLLRQEQPDRVLILGDTNSGLASFVARRLGIPVYHMEAGNRCFDPRVPEETNRRVIDSCSEVLLPYTERSRQYLLAEGFAPQNIFVTGNPIGEILSRFDQQISASSILETLDIEPRGFLLVTLHRSENVDEQCRLLGFLKAFNDLGEKLDVSVVVSLHPRTRSKLQDLGQVEISSRVKLCPPFGFFDFVKLEKAARCVLTDSGTVQEETAILGVPNVILRDVTERPETVEVGSTIITGPSSEEIVERVVQACSMDVDWTAPPEYLKGNVASTVVRILLSHRK
jgi:UDP-N-acetylglucosamine 2-epimerase (non-hydrolysing)